jgi:hypothetical protein
LPARAGQRRADRGDQPAVAVAGHQAHAGQAAGGQVAEEAQPARAVLGAGGLQAEDLAVPVGVHAGREQRMDVHNPAALADLEHQRVSRDERVGPGVQRSAAEVRDMRIEVLGHHADLALAQPVMPRVSTSFSIRRVLTPSR